MLIASGWAKGLRLKTPKGQATRPTAARVRGAILNMLATDLEEAMILDLFAGSGALGIEAVSRGARGAVFVENGREALRCLHENLTELKRRASAQGLTPASLQVSAGDVGQVVPKLPASSFDMVFTDPPYHAALDWVLRLAPPLAAVTTPEAVWVIETAASDGPDLTEARVEPWVVMRQRRYGDTMISVLEKNAD